MEPLKNSKLKKKEKKTFGFEVVTKKRRAAVDYRR